jgi:hypothetical protein
MIQQTPYVIARDVVEVKESMDNPTTAKTIDLLY